MKIQSRFSRFLIMVPAAAVIMGTVHLVSRVEGEIPLDPEKLAIIQQEPASAWETVDCSQCDIVREYYDSGEVRCVYRLKNTLKNGPAYHFYKNGELKQVENWKNDMKDGKFAAFYDGGGLRCSGTMIADKLEGKVCYFAPDRTIKFIESYENGASVGREYK